MSESEESPQSWDKFICQGIAENLIDSTQRSEVAKYLSPTPESFLELLRLLQCDRVYRSPIYDEYWSILTKPSERTLIMMPRGSYKSTCLMAACIRWILIDPNVRILYASETYGNAKTYVGLIKAQFESNVELKRVFGEQKGPFWRQEAFTVAGRSDLSKKEPTITAAGIDVTKTGMHFEIMVMDDLVSRENTRTALTISQVIDWYKLALSFAEEGTVVVVNGTPYEDSDLYSHIQTLNAELIKQSSQGKPVKPYRVFIKPARTPSGAVQYRHIDENELQQKLIEHGPRRFSSQYLLDPVPSEYALFKRDYFKVIPTHQIPPVQAMNIYMLTDTATSEDREDDTVLTIIGKDILDNAWVLDMDVGQWAPAEVLQRLTSLYVKWSCRRVLMEKIATNEIYSAMIGSWGIENQSRINIVPVGGRTTESKSMRIESLQGRFVSGKLFFSSALKADLIRVENGQCYGKIVEEFVRYAPNRRVRDDIPDCLSDMDKTDPQGAKLCPPPKMRASAIPQGRMVNGRFVTAPPKAVASGGNFWGELASQVGRK